jgi:site-specific DNA-methyltransferase (adenine-specific)
MIINKTLLLGDYKNVSHLIESGSVKLLFTDPPYKMTAQHWDVDIDLNFFWKESDRILEKNGNNVIFSSQPYTTELISSNQKKYRYSWYWIKNQATNFFHAKRMPLRRVEELCVFGNSKSFYNPVMSEGNTPTNSAKGCSNGVVYHGKNKRNYEGGVTSRYPSNVLEFKCVDNYSRKHPNQKPVDLCEYIIKTYTEENDLVVDFFAGVGSVAVAAKKLNRRCISVEKNIEYFNIMKERIENDID